MKGSGHAKRPESRYACGFVARAIVSVVVVTAAVAICGCIAPAKPLPEAPLGPVAAGPDKSGTSQYRQTLVTMLDARIGWVLTGTALLRTTDGGMHWMNVTPRSASVSQETHQLGRLYAAGLDSAWLPSEAGAGAQGVILFHTNDGGKTWSESQVGYIGHQWPLPIGISFSGESHGALLIGYKGAAMGSQMVAVFTTSDAGATWSKTAFTEPGTGEAPNTLPLRGVKSGVAFADPNHGWITGRSNSPGIWLYLSADGGRSWEPQGLPVQAGYSTSSGNVDTLPPLFFGRDGFLPAVFHMESSLIFFATHDGGTTWVATAPVRSTSDSYDFSWCFVDGAYGWVSDTARIFRTSDGAVTWKEIKPDNVLTPLLQGGYRIEYLSFCDGQNGWAMLRTGDADNVTDRLLITTGGGRSWNDRCELSGK